MPISVAEHRALECPSCGHVTSMLMWLVADLVERPDLRLLLQDLDVYCPRCSECGELVEREDPLLVLAIADEAPVVLACPDRILFSDDPAASAQGLIGVAHAALREERRTLAGPLLPAPFDVVAVALTRNVDADVAAVDAAIESVRERHGDSAAERHGIFLRDVEGSRRQRRLNLAHEALDRIGSASELEELIDRFPELLTAEARRQPEEIVAAARAAGDEPAVRAIIAKLDLLDHCASGSVREAWTAYRKIVEGFYAEVLEPQVKPLLDEFESIVHGDPGRAADIGDQLVGRIAELGALPMEAEVGVRVAALHWTRADGDRGASLERCRVLLERAIWIMERDLESAPHDLYVGALLALGAVMGARHAGDPAVNQERATALQCQVLEHTTRQENGRIWATAQRLSGLLCVKSR